MSENGTGPAPVTPPGEVVEAIGLDATLLRSADVAVVVALGSGGAAVVELDVTVTGGETHRIPAPEQFVDREFGVLELTRLVTWLGVEPDESPESMRDGYAGLMVLARKHFVPWEPGTTADDARVSVMLVPPGELVGGQETQLWGFGLHPLWDPVSRIPLGRFPSGHGHRTATMASEVEKAPPLPEVGDTEAWPDTVAGWTAFIDARLKVDEDLEADEIRAMYAGYEGDHDPKTDPLDPTLEEAMRVRSIPGALPPPESLPDGPRQIGPTRVRRPPSPQDHDVPAGEDLPIVPFENTLYIYDRRGDMAPPAFQRDPEAARREWLATLEWLKSDASTSTPPPVPAGLIVPDPDPQLDIEPNWPDGGDGDEADDGGFGPEDVLPLDEADRDLLNRGCLGWFVDHKGLAAGAAGAVLLLLVVGVILFGGEDSGSTRSDTAAEPGEGSVGVVSVSDYADLVCGALDENLAGPSGRFQDAFEASSGAAPPTPEATRALYDDLGAGAAALAAGLNATADDLTDGPTPDVDGGEAANRAAVATYRGAAATAAEIAAVIAAYDPVSATPAETEALGVELNELFTQLDVLGSEFADAPEVTAALSASAVCAEADAGAGQ